MKPFAIALFASLLHAQEPAGAIEGNLRDAITRAPIAAARISLRGPGSRSTTTAFDGAFRFLQLAPGDYDLSIEKAGYLDSSKGAPQKSVRLKPGAVTESLVIDLTPLGAIEGTILGEDNKPLAGVYVTVARDSHITAKDGRFSFEDMVPGSYQVAVSVPHAVRSANLVRDSATGDFYGYGAAQYYPGADDVRLAIPVAIPPGDRLRNMDLRLRRTLLVEFAGRLVEMSGREPVTGGEVQLIGGVPGTPDPLWRRHAAGSDGSFRFSLIQPGSYTLAVYRPGLSQLPYLVPVEIGKAGADDLPVPIPPFQRIQSILKLLDPKLQWQGTLGVTLRHRLSPAIAACEMKPGGNCDFDSVPPGEYTVEVQPRTVSLVNGRGRRLFAKEIHLGAQNGLRRPITVVENGNPPLEIQLSDEPAGIAGKVIESERRGNYIVSVATTPGRTFSALATAAPDFQFPELGPGDYEVTAWRFVSVPRSITGQVCDETVRVTVREGAVSNITLRPCP